MTRIYTERKEEMEEDKAIVKSEEVIACEAREAPRLFSAEEIARLFHVPPELLGEVVEDVIECEAVPITLPGLVKASAWEHGDDAWFGSEKLGGKYRFR